VAKPILPVWKKMDPETGEWIFGLRPEDLARVEAGYACFNCLEPFEHWTPVCPVCQRAQDRIRVVKVEGW
jgi:hypothetical protein